MKGRLRTLLLALLAILAFLPAFADARGGHSSGPHYGGGHHTTSHGGSLCQRARVFPTRAATTRIRGLAITMVTIVPADHSEGTLGQKLISARETCRRRSLSVAVAAVFTCLIAGCSVTSPIQPASSSKSAFEGAVYKGETVTVSAGTPGTEAYRVFNQGASGFVCFSQYEMMRSKDEGFLWPERQGDGISARDDLVAALHSG